LFFFRIVLLETTRSCTPIWNIFSYYNRHPDSRQDKNEKYQRNRVTRWAYISSWTWFSPWMEASSSMGRAGSPSRRRLAAGCSRRERRPPLPDRRRPRLSPLAPPLSFLPPVRHSRLSRPNSHWKFQPPSFIGHGSRGVSGCTGHGSVQLRTSRGLRSPRPPRPLAGAAALQWSHRRGAASICT
jgi:hypothetical protein